MSAKGAFRGAATAWMALIVLHTVGSANGSSRLAQLFTDVDNLVKRALSPDVPAIPDRRNLRGTAIVTADGTPTGGYLDPGGRYIPPADASLPQPGAGQLTPHNS
jgi:hypothetical protein